MFRFMRFVLSVATFFAIGLVISDGDSDETAGIPRAASGYAIVDIAGD